MVRQSDRIAAKTRAKKHQLDEEDASTPPPKKAKPTKPKPAPKPKALTKPKPKPKAKPKPAGKPKKPAEAQSTPAGEDAVDDAPPAPVEDDFAAFLADVSTFITENANATNAALQQTIDTVGTLVADGMTGLTDRIVALEQRAVSGCPCKPAEAAAAATGLPVDTTATNEQPPKTNAAGKNVTGQKASASTKDTPRSKSFRYPAISKARPASDNVCDRFNDLIRYWTFHRALSTSTFVELLSTDQVPEDIVFTAINSVTEALSRVPEATQKYSLMTESGMWSMRYKLTIGRDEMIDHNAYKFGQHFQPQEGEKHCARDKLLFPFVLNNADSSITELNSLDFEGADMDALCKSAAEGGHIFLFKLQRTNTGFNLERLDSSTVPVSFAMRPLLVAHLKKILILGQWMTEDEGKKIWTTVEGSTCQQRYIASTGQTCGIHTILNAWVSALELTLNSAFVPGEAFYREAVSMINLAMSGYMDSTTISCWLHCRGYTRFENVSAGKRVVPTFNRTLTCHKHEDVNNYRNMLNGMYEEELIGGAPPYIRRSRSPESAEPEVPTEPAISPLRAELLAAKIAGAAFIPDEHLAEFHGLWRNGEVLRRLESSGWTLHETLPTEPAELPEFTFTEATPPVEGHSDAGEKSVWDPNLTEALNDMSSDDLPAPEDNTQGSPKTTTAPEGTLPSSPQHQGSSPADGHYASGVFASDGAISSPAPQGSSPGDSAGVNGTLANSGVSLLHAGSPGGGVGDVSSVGNDSLFDSPGMMAAREAAKRAAGRSAPK